MTPLHYPKEGRDGRGEIPEILAVGELSLPLTPKTQKRRMPKSR